MNTTAKLLNDFLGSTQVFAKAVNNVVEKRLLRAVAGNQVTFSQFRLLKLVALTDSHNISDVAAFLGVSSAAASKTVDKLVRRGLLLRREGETDRRAIELLLTPPSRRLLAEYEATKRRKLTKLFRQFPTEDLRRTAELLDRLSAGIVNHSARPEEVCLQCGIYYRERCLVRELVGRNCFFRTHRTRRRLKGATKDNGAA